jgi:homocysteine S-methyltransferase
MALETVPSLDEAEVLADLLREVPHAWAWITFSCGDGERLRDGSPVADAVRAVDGAANLAAVGVNCTPPQFISSLIERVREVTRRPIIVYPNSGEVYDAGSHRWGGTPAGAEWVERAREWVGLGARVIGGCCRVGPRTISRLRAELVRSATRR